MGSEQSQQANSADAQRRLNNQSRFKRGHTIAVSERRLSSPNDESATSQVPSGGSRPVSPPISVCSDSDLPYVSYTDKLGGKFSVNKQFISTLPSMFFFLYKSSFYSIKTHQNGRTKDQQIISEM